MASNQCMYFSDTAPDGALYLPPNVIYRFLHGCFPLEAMFLREEYLCNMSSNVKCYTKGLVFLLLWKRFNTLHTCKRLHLEDKQQHPYACSFLILGPAKRLSGTSELTESQPVEL